MSDICCDACSREEEMLNRSHLLALLPPLALMLILSACERERSIDVSNSQNFEKSLAETKKSLTPSEQMRLANAIFAIATRHVTPQLDVERTRDYIRHLDHSNFVKGFYSSWNSYGQTVKEATFVNIIDAAMFMHLDTNNPIPPLLDQFVTRPEAELQKAVNVNRENEFVTLVLPADGKSSNRLGCTFSIKNDSKWPITRVGIGYGYTETTQKVSYHDFNPALEPGHDADLVLEALGRLSSCMLQISVNSVDVVGREPFTPMRKADWQRAKQQLALLTGVRAEIAPRLQEILDWLRSIH
jgi:hypothetical protein